MTSKTEPLRIFLVAGEHSGDQLGGKLIPEIRRLSDSNVSFSGVGAEMMAAQGCSSLFPLSDVAVMGPLAILGRLSTIVRRVYQTVDAAVQARPHALVILDSPEFTHPIAKRVRRRLPSVPVIDYVSPSVWAWRSGRARKMRAYVDHVLALLPFEPAAHKRLDGPDCTYIGHPLIERREWVQSLDPQELADKLGLKGDCPVLVFLPGSRSNEIKKMIDIYGQTLTRLMETAGRFDVIVPTASSIRRSVEEGVAKWPIKPHVVEGEKEKYQAFRLARAALATSGTVTLELALTGTPMVVAYRIEWLATLLRYFISAPSIVLPNLILEKPDSIGGDSVLGKIADEFRPLLKLRPRRKHHLLLENNIFPELIQENCTPEKLSTTLLPLLRNGPERKRQLAAMVRLEKRMAVPSGMPSSKAAEIILRLARQSG